MTVNEYRKKNPSCYYCAKGMSGLEYCTATEKKRGKWTAKRCPCYEPEPYEKENKAYNPPSIRLIKTATEYGVIAEGMSTELILRKIYEKEKK